MLSSEDLERFYFQYQTEAVPLGMSVQTFCLRNNVPYNIFHKWYKDTRKRIVRVQMDGTPPDPVPDMVPTVCPQEEKTAVPTRMLTEQPPASFQGSSPSSSSGATRISAELQLSNGLHIVQKDLDYQGLCRLVEKLEALC